MLGGDGFGTEPNGELDPFFRRNMRPPSNDRGASLPAGRVPPHHTEAERSVLGAILLSNESIHRVIEIGLESRDFYRESHQKIFEVLLTLSERGEPVDLVTLTSALRDRNYYE